MYKIAWDLLMAFFVLYTVIAVPYRIGFATDPSDAETGFEVFITICFAVDIFINFHTAYLDNEAETWVTDKRLIARNYMSCWFWIDVAATVPFDQIVGAFSSQDGNLSTIRVIRIVRLLRLFKIQRILKQNETFEVLFHPLVYNSVTLLSQIFIIAHVVACFWHYITLSDDINAHFPNTWVQVYGYADKSTRERYVASLYYVFVTMMTVGYGDICPVNELERFYAIMTMLVGTIVFGGLVSQVTQLVQTRNPHQQKYNEQVREFKDFVANLSLPVALKDRAKNAYNYSVTKKSLLGESDDLDSLAKPFLIELVYGLYEKEITQISFFRRQSDRMVVVELLKHGKPFEAFPGDVLYEEGDLIRDLVFIKTGLIGLHLHLRSVSHGSKASQNDLCTVGYVSDGNMFGDLELERKASTAIVQYSALKHTHCLSVPFVQFNQILSEHVELSQKFQYYMTFRAHSFGEVVKIKQQYVSFIPSASSASFSVAFNPMVGRESESVAVPKGPMPGKDAMFWVNGDIVSNTVEMRKKYGINVHIPHTNKHRRGTVISAATEDDAECEKECEKEVQLRVIEDMNALPTKDPAQMANIRVSMLVNPLAEDKNEAQQQEKNLVVKEISLEKLHYIHYLIHPAHQYKIYWDLFIGLLILFSVLVVPVQIGFQTDGFDDQGITNYIITAFFFLDIVANFRTAVEYSELDCLIIDPKYIAWGYLKGWFIVDMLSTFPFDAFGAGTGGATSLVKVFRLFRLFRLFRVLKFGVYLEKIEAYSGISPALFELLSLLLQLFFIAHLIACFWWGITTAMTTNPWYTNTGGDSTEHTISGFAFGRLSGDGIKPSAQYLMSIYFIFTTMTTVGYGDVHPFNLEERIVAIVIMVFGASMFGYMIANIGGILTSLSASDSSGNNNDKLAEISGYLDERHCTPEVTTRILKYFKRQLKESSSYDANRLTNHLPDMISNRILFAYHEATIRKIAIFQHIPNTSIALYLFSLLKPIYCDVDHYICRENKESNELVFLLNGRAKVFQRTKKHDGNLATRLLKRNMEKARVNDEEEKKEKKAQPSTELFRLKTFGRSSDHTFGFAAYDNPLPARSFSEAPDYARRLMSTETRAILRDLDSIFDSDGNSLQSDQAAAAKQNFVPEISLLDPMRLNDDIDDCPKAMKLMTSEDFREYGFDYLGDFTAGDFVGYFQFLSQQIGTSATSLGVDMMTATQAKNPFHIRAIDSCTIFTLSKSQIMNLLKSEPVVGLALQNALIKAIVAQEKCITKWKKQLMRHQFFEEIFEEYLDKNAKADKDDAVSRQSLTLHPLQVKRMMDEQLDRLNANTAAVAMDALGGQQDLLKMFTPTQRLQYLCSSQGLIGKKKRDIWYDFEKEKKEHDLQQQQRERKNHLFSLNEISTTITNTMQHTVNTVNNLATQAVSTNRATFSGPSSKPQCVVYTERQSVRRYSLSCIDVDVMDNVESKQSRGFSERSRTHNLRRRQSFPSKDNYYWPDMSIWIKPANPPSS